MEHHHCRTTRTHWRRLALMAATAAGLCLFTLQAGAQTSGRAKSKADEWIGRDASDLLLQLRVDGGRVQITEDDEAGQTHYTWSTINPAWIETWTTGGNVVGISYGAPMYDGPVQVHERHHEATHRCSITFIADMEGIVRKWEMNGSACGSDVKRPKN